MKIFDRINIIPIFRLHLTSFYDYRNRVVNDRNEIPFPDVFIFLIFPSIISILFIFLDLKFSLEYINIIITSLSIFTGLLFSLLTLIFDSVKKETERYKQILKERNDAENEEKIAFKEQIQIQEKKKNLTIELFQNIAFAVALSLFSIVVTLSTQLKLPDYLLVHLKKLKYYSFSRNAFFYLINFIAFFFIIQFILALLMILKRFFNLFITEKNTNQNN